MKAKACRQLQTALQALYGHYEKTFEPGAREKISVPPCFVIVCNNTAASKLVYDYISRFQQPHKDGASKLVKGRLPLFRNCDEHGNLAKGLEFRAVAVMACDDEIIPLQSRIESVADDADLEEVYKTERHLLYVACTRARDHLLITCVEPGSEFLEDMRVAPAKT